MRALVILALVPATVLAQDAETTTDAAAWTFSFEQGWKLVTTFNAKLTGETTEPDVTAGLAAPTLARCEPIVAEGTIALDRGGAWRAHFDRVEYYDAQQRWWIDFRGTKVVTRDLLVERWSGKPEDWPARLAEVEKTFFAAYARLAERRPAPAAPQLGAIPAAVDPGRSLFVLCALEDQLAALALARLQDRAFDEKTLAEYPSTVVRIVRGIYDRLTAQCKGELAPEAARAKASRTVENGEWDRTLLAVPSFPWDVNAKWREEREKRREESRARLEALIEKSRKAPIGQAEWDQAVEAERAKFAAPVILEPGRGRYMFKEQLKLDGARASTSKACAVGIGWGQVVAFYDCQGGAWRVALVEYKTWWTSAVARR